MSNIEILDFTIFDMLKDWEAYRDRFAGKVLAFDRGNDSIVGFADTIHEAINNYPDCRHLIPGKK